MCIIMIMVCVHVYVYLTGKNIGIGSESGVQDRACCWNLHKKVHINCTICQCTHVHVHVLKQVNKKFCELKGRNIGIAEKAKETRSCML